MAELRCSMSGQLKNAAACIEALMEELRYVCDADKIEAIEDEHQPSYYISALQETARHAEETAAGKHTLQRFAEFYCLLPEPQPMTPADIVEEDRR